MKTFPQKNVNKAAKSISWNNSSTFKAKNKIDLNSQWRNNYSSNNNGAADNRYQQCFNLEDGREPWAQSTGTGFFWP